MTLPAISVPAQIIGALIVVPLGLLVAAVLLRSACDLCSAEAPGWVRSLVIVVVLHVISAALVVPIVVFDLLGIARWGLSPFEATAVGVILTVPFQAGLAALLVKALVRTKYLSALVIWCIYSLLGVLLASLVILLGVGGWTLVESLRRVS